MTEDEQKIGALASTPTWSVAAVMTIFVAVSLLVERSIHRLSSWLRDANRKPLLEALERMKEELMLLGFISLLLTATSSGIAGICIPSKFYDSSFVPCRLKPEIKEQHERKLSESETTCEKDHVPFVSDKVLEQLHQFIFVMAVTHISYSCLTMLLAIVKIYSWRKWEDEAQMDRHNSLRELTREMTMRRQANFVNYHTSNPLTRNKLLMLLICFFRQFGHSVDHADYLTLRQGFISNHRLPLKYDFHNYMIRSMEEEFQMIVGVRKVRFKKHMLILKLGVLIIFWVIWLHRYDEMANFGDDICFNIARTVALAFLAPLKLTFGPLWGLVVFFMLFNVQGSNFYFWIAFIPIGLVLLVGSKLQHIIATLALESAGIAGFSGGAKPKPRDKLFWFKKPELLLYLIHFILFQNSFELASFFWFWWKFGYDSCFIKNHLMVYIRLFLGFAGQVLCSFSTLPIYALVTQMGTNHKAALIPHKLRDAVESWRKMAKEKRRLRVYNDNSPHHTDASTMVSIDEHDENQPFDNLEIALKIFSDIESRASDTTNGSETVANETSLLAGMPLLRPYASVSTPITTDFDLENFIRSLSMPAR